MDKKTKCKHEFRYAETYKVSYPADTMGIVRTWHRYYCVKCLHIEAREVQIEDWSKLTYKG